LLTALLKQVRALPVGFPGMETLSSEVVYLMGCRSFEQFCCSIRALAEPGKFCPFCSSERIRRRRRSFAEIGRWFILRNEFPHRNVAQMWLIIPQRHVVDVSELNDRDWKDIGRAFAVCQRQIGITAGGIMFRFGDPRLNVGTVEHLHINIVEPVCGKEYRPPFAKNLDEHATDYSRMLNFRNEMNEWGGATWLFSAEGIEKTQPST